MLQSKLRPLADCGLPSFNFAGFQWPRYLATLPAGSLRKRAESRKPGRAMCGDYYHAPTPDGAKGRGFYLDSDGMPGLRWQWCDEVEGAPGIGVACSGCRMAFNPFNRRPPAGR